MFFDSFLKNIEATEITEKKKIFMRDHYSHPKLRWPLDIRFHEIESRKILLLSCPLGITNAPLGLVAAVAPIIAHFEGKLSVQEITLKFAAHGVEDKLIHELVKILDQHYFLESPRFFGAEKGMKEEFKTAAVRQSALAGVSYPALPEMLRIEIDGYLKNGAGIVVSVPGKLVGLVSPHIDYRRGGVCYGITYNVLHREKHDLYIVIGTSHQFSRNLFHLTYKDFETPLGRLPTNRAVVERLARAYGTQRSFADEFLHKREHSLELQLPFLQNGAAPVEIVPILVGSFFNIMRSGKLPNDHDEYDSLIGELAECVKEQRAQGRRVCIVAGVDMAHIGRNFSDQGSLSEEIMKAAGERDKIYLDCICAQNKRALFAHIAEDSDARRICGYPTMYSVLDLFDRLNIKYRAQLFDYRQAVDYATDCAVTFAGMGLYEQSV